MTKHKPARTEVDGWRLVWSDEFGYTGRPDSTKWEFDSGGHGWGNQELQYYTDRHANSRVENGCLVLEARSEKLQSCGYTSARLVTRNKGDWLYGRVEVRAVLPAARGTWPAIWMLPTDNAYGRWPSSGEIDIMEHVGWQPGVVHASVHTADFNHRRKNHPTASVNRPDVVSAFHIYAVEWSKDSIRFFVDDTCYHRWDNQNDGYGAWPFDKPFHLVLNIAVGGSWGGAQGVDEKAFPQRMLVDYVRVYAKR